MMVFPEQPLPVPTSALYSKTNGVVHWSSCLEFEGAQSENIEMLGSRSGMAHNPLGFHVLADRLAQREGEWQPFKRKRGCRTVVFPKPEARRPPCAS